LAHLVNAYLDEMSKAVIGLVGHVLKRLGDGLMALFRYDAAQENDANAPRAKIQASEHAKPREVERARLLRLSRRRRA
jgi:class 3 adenylate cyclase